MSPLLEEIARPELSACFPARVAYAVAASQTVAAA